MFNLIENECFKIIYKKRLLVIFTILLVLVSLFAYGENQSLNRTKARLSSRIGITGTTDWQQLARQQVMDLKDRLANPYLSDRNKSSLTVRIDQLDYYLAHNINPLDNSAAKFTTTFMEQSISLFLPLLIILLAGDMVSGEAASGTIKLLLTRNVPRWKIYLSKYISLLIMEMIVLLLAVLISAAVSGIFFGYGGWTAPVATGFRVIGDNLDTSAVVNVPQWQYILMVYALAYFVSIVVAGISLAISVFMRSTAASIGIMMAAIIGGNFLSHFMSDWKAARYLFMVNMRLTDYLSGSFQPVAGVNMVFSLTVLAVWAVAALIVGFVYFIRQDILV